MTMKMKDIYMSTYKLPNETFPFWLVRHFLESDNDPGNNAKPISDREFYSIFAMIIGSLIILNLVFHLI
jgi:hypothetical protein